MLLRPTAKPFRDGSGRANGERRVSWLGGLVIVLVAMLAGCSGSGPRPMRVWGTVSLDGQPIEEGEIIFQPLEGTDGPSTGGPIARGKYDVAAEQGPLAGGKYRVELSALGKPRTYTPNANGEGPFITVRDNLLPAKFNKESTLQVTISDKPAENQHDFALTP